MSNQPVTDAGTPHLDAYSIQAWLAKARVQLEASTELSSEDSARLDAEVLLCHVLAKPRSYLYTWPERALSDDQVREYQALLAKRALGQPVAHLVGQREFWSLPLSVCPSTLIPRPETELLVETALNLDLPADAGVLDLGTGTGAIALALASECPGWQITATDRVAEALALAKKNADSLGLGVRFLLGEWFQALSSSANEGVSATFDLIISNPPYIDAEDPHLAEGDVRFEPLSALVAAQNGLSDIRQIAEGAGAHLKPGGWLLVEHGYQQAEDVTSIFRQHGFTAVRNLLDLGKRPRCTLGRLAPTG